MTLAQDIANDLSLADGTEQITFTSAAGGSPVADVTALRRALSLRELSLVANTVAIQASDVTFLVSANDIGTATVVQGSKITDAASVVYTVLWAQKILLGTRWRCYCRQEVA